MGERERITRSTTWTSSATSAVPTRARTNWSGARTHPRAIRKTRPSSSRLRISTYRPPKTHACIQTSTGRQTHLRKLGTYVEREREGRGVRAGASRCTDRLGRHDALERAVKLAHVHLAHRRMQAREAPRHLSGRRVPSVPYALGVTLTDGLPRPTRKSGRGRVRPRPRGWRKSRRRPWSCAATRAPPSRPAGG
jgi:hypothetical protein